jgi:hypothetical protein
MEETLIRHYQEGDRSLVREIAWDTAFIGEPAGIFFKDREILTDFLTKYYTDYEPGSCFVAQSPEGRVVGYLIGAKDTRVSERIFQTKILPGLLRRALLSRAFLKKKNLAFIFHLLISFLRGEFKMPDFRSEYPATLHINIEEKSRHLKIGSRLIAAYLDYLIQEKIPGVSMATMSDQAGEFFVQQGFNLLYKGNRSYFRYLLQKDTPVYIYGKKLKITSPPNNLRTNLSKLSTPLI